MKSGFDMTLTGNIPHVASSRRSSILAEAHNNSNAAESLEGASKIAFRSRYCRPMRATAYLINNLGELSGTSGQLFRV